MYDGFQVGRKSFGFLHNAFVAFDWGYFITGITT
jgi:hypothetical protein